jgi:hypothetical protein
LLTDEVLEHYLKLRGRSPSVVGGITITITIGRRIRPIIVTSKIVPISIIVEIIVSNEVYINMLFLSNQRGLRNIIRINMSSIIRKNKHYSINLITQGRGFLNRIYLLTLWSSLGVSLRIIYHHVVKKLGCDAQGKGHKSASSS